VGCSTYKNDYIELFKHRGRQALFSVNGWSVQYAAAATGTTWQVDEHLPNVSIQPGQYFPGRGKASARTA